MLNSKGEIELMKGFLGALFVFFLWSASCIYYVSSGESQQVDLSSEELPSPDPKDIANDTRPNLSSIDFTDLDNSAFSSNKTKISTISRSESKLLADELMKSFAISDTIDFERDEPKLTLENTLKIAPDLSVNSNVFYPRYESTNLIVDKDLVKYATNLKKILNENPSKRATIVGHTDNVGNGNDNFSIGLKKARQIKWYLTVRRDIPRSKIKAISRGEEDPIESNNSVWGRNKNNRVQIIVN